MSEMAEPDLIESVSIMDLPDEIVLLVIMYLEAKDAISLCRVNKQLNSLAEDDIAWRKLFVQAHPTAKDLHFTPRGFKVLFLQLRGRSVDSLFWGNGASHRVLSTSGVRLRNYDMVWHSCEHPLFGLDNFHTLLEVNYPPRSVRPGYHISYLQRYGKRFDVFVRVVGAAGVGKTTLLRSLFGGEKTDEIDHTIDLYCSVNYYATKLHIETANTVLQQQTSAPKSPSELLILLVVSVADPTSLTYALQQLRLLREELRAHSRHKVGVQQHVLLFGNKVDTYDPSLPATKQALLSFRDLQRVASDFSGEGLQVTYSEGSALTDLGVLDALLNEAKHFVPPLEELVLDFGVPAAPSDNESDSDSSENSDHEEKPRKRSCIIN